MTLFRDGQCEPLNRWPEPAQIAGFAASALLINFIIGMLISPLGLSGSSELKKNLIDQQGVFFTFFLLVVVAPFTETLYGQWLPLFVGKIAKRPRPVLIVWAACWFAILHIPDGFSAVLQMFGVGWVLASCFLYCRNESWLKAYRVTSMAHLVHNLTVFVLS